MGGLGSFGDFLSPRRAAMGVLRTPAAPLATGVLVTRATSYRSMK